MGAAFEDGVKMALAAYEKSHFPASFAFYEVEAGTWSPTFVVLRPMLPMIPDRPQIRPHEPTLAEMTRKAVELLSADPDGFFLMVEGSQIDWANHANDPAHLLSDLIMFDHAVQVALEFAERDEQTLVLALFGASGYGLGIFIRPGAKGPIFWHARR